jgi:hypothetical protein
MSFSMFMKSSSLHRKPFWPAKFLARMSRTACRAAGPAQGLTVCQSCSLCFVISPQNVRRDRKLPIASSSCA